MRYRRRRLHHFTAFALLVSVGGLKADVKMSPIFGDHMVLQQGKNLPVWGTADAGESVTVKVGNQSATATTGADGKWMVKLAPLAVSNTPVEMLVQGANQLKFEDVLVGEVWLCSGQSNMEIGFNILDSDYTKFNRNIHPSPKEAIAQANVPLLRLFAVPKIASLTPVEEINAVADKPDIAHWEVCTPESITKAGVWGGFSALGYFFGREIQRNKGGPVGLIGAYWGGTPAQAWISSEGLAKDPALSEYITERQTRADALAKAQADYPAKKTAYEALLAKSNQASSPAADAPKPPAIPGVGSGTPTALFNGIIAPILPYAIQGAIWYQGESNAGNEHSAKLYHALFSDMITDWRAKFYEGDFPFLYVQLAAFGQNAKFWPYLRESQFETLSLPNVGMVSAIDIGDPACVHPGDKLNVGSRLALAAEHLAYGKNVVYSGPLYDKMSVEKDGIHLTFTQTGGGLKIGAPPTFASGVTPPPADKLVGFVIAGSDQHWFPADAKIVGNEVIVSSPQVASPVAVRYAWEQMPTINFYNKEGLPASPFRTDDWEEIETTPAPLKK